MNCDIIRDLIPSYVEDICSKSSKECVEEHIAGCEKCRDLVQLYKENDFSMNSLEKKQLDGWKKVKNKVKIQNVFSYGLLLGLIVFGIYTYEINHNPLPPMVYYVLFAVSMIATNILTMNQQVTGYLCKRDKALTVISVVSIVYGILMYCFVMISVLNDKIPFGMDASDVGLFLHTQIGIVLVIQMIIFGYVIYRSIKENIACNWILNINLAGMFLILIHTTLLRSLSDATTYIHKVTEVTLIIVVIGVIGTGVQYIMTKRK